MEVTDRVPVASGGASSSFAHSFETGEIWPAVYEKAYAKWRFGTADDFPKIPDLAWGDPVAATRARTAGNAYYRWHAGMTSEQLLTLVRSHSSGGRTTTPMVAWSHGAGSPEATDAAPLDRRLAGLRAKSCRRRTSSGTDCVRSTTSSRAIGGASGKEPGRRPVAASSRRMTSAGGATSSWVQTACSRSRSMPSVAISPARAAPTEIEFDTEPGQVGAITAGPVHVEVRTASAALCCDAG